MPRSLPAVSSVVAAAFLAFTARSAHGQNAPATTSDTDWRYHLSIHDIARADDDQKLSQLVADNPDRVLVRLPDGRTAAHVAAEVGALKSLRVLAGDKYGKGVFSWASHSGAPAFRYALYLNPQPNSRDLTTHKPS